MSILLTKVNFNFMSQKKGKGVKACKCNHCKNPCPVCGKENAQPETWEERFENTFVYEGETIPTSVMKNFIRSELTRQDQAVRDEVRKVIKKLEFDIPKASDFEPDQRMFDRGLVQGKKQIISDLTQKLGL